jgi:hypothetical protein
MRWGKRLRCIGYLVREGVNVAQEIGGNGKKRAIIKYIRVIANIDFAGEASPNRPRLHFFVVSI